MKKKRQNNTIDGFAASFVKGVIDNPVYCGKLAYGRRKTEKVQGKQGRQGAADQDHEMEGVKDGQDGRAFVLRDVVHAGDAIQIPGGTPHGPIEILEDSVIIDTFSPKRREFEK